MKILVTGGAGYIGSHTCVELLNAGHDVVVFDNFSNASPEVLNRIKQITNKDILCVKGDVQDEGALRALFAAHKFDGVLHFAGLKAVGESTQKPDLYYENNFVGSLKLLKAMEEADVKLFIFSSSATVYTPQIVQPIPETAEVGYAASPYGNTKLLVEILMRDWAAYRRGWKMAALRYFNPVGAHESGMIGEDPAGVPNNLMPYVAQVAIGRRPFVHVFGNDYPTPDGTGVRDYIHVVDLAKGHVAALDYLASARCEKALSVFNLGTGKGSSVLDVIKAFEKACGHTIPYQIEARRAGDIALYYGDPALAGEVLGWRAARSLEEMAASSWKWQSLNPKGYGA